MRRLLLLSACLAAAGCQASSSRDGSSGDDRAARELLTTVLDAWKDGKAAGHRKRTPPIRFSDDDQRAGFRLDSYQFVNAEEPILPFHNTDVRLTLVKASGPKVERVASYQVSLKPELAVLRSDP